MKLKCPHRSFVVLCILSFTFIGECTYNIFAQNIHVALRSSDCDDFCQCTYNTSTTFKWVRSHCSPGTKFDNAINACNHASSVTCGKCILLYISEIKLIQLSVFIYTRSIIQMHIATSVLFLAIIQFIFNKRKSIIK